VGRIAMGLCLSFLIVCAGCSGKRVSTGSGDQTSRAGQTKSEAIKPDAIATLPTDRSIDRQAGSTNKPSDRMPGDVSLSTPAGSVSGTGSAGNPLGDAFFDFDRFQVRNDAMPVLDANARWLRANANKTALIEGHCDERGTMAYNLVLGEKRARAAKAYLQDLGIPPSQLQITSYGETRPFCKQQNEECYQQNRRAHFVTK